jgi:DtxR family Mn-dependent transcriptional regulator
MSTPTPETTEPISGPLGRTPLSPAVEDYLKTIYTLRAGGLETVSTQSIASRLNIAAPSATAMCKKLTQMGLAAHTPYYGIELTDAGTKIALEVIRHHRIIETYLAEVLGMPWDKVHDEAERLEHVLSEDLEALMMDALGHPKRDPHGAPIPSIDGVIEHGENEICLTEVTSGTNATIVQVDDASPETLRHLSELGLRPTSQIKVVRNEQIEGLIWLEVGGKEVVVGLTPAKAVWLEVN